MRSVGKLFPSKISHDMFASRTDPLSAPLVRQSIEKGTDKIREGAA